MKRRINHGSVLLLSLSIAIGVAQPVRSAATITYVGVIYDQMDFARLNIGNSGFWFPQFDSANPVSMRPTGENPRDSLPSWAGPLNHATSILDPDFSTRTFSQDGPARSKGGQPTWNTFTLPDGEVGLSGAIVDPYARANSNNTINRIQLRSGVPDTFYFHVVTDNTNFEHDPTNRLRARGNAGGMDIEANFFPQTAHLIFNGIADVYTFRYDGFASGDYIKLQLNGDAAPKLGASFAGVLFDETFQPNLMAPIPGDYNRNDAVDAADYVVWRNSLGQSGSGLPADGNPNNIIDAEDYDVWKTQFGQPASPGFSSAQRELLAVPEPRALIPLVMAGLRWLQCRRKVATLRDRR